MSDLFGDLFDFNGDGKVDPDEEFMGFLLLSGAFGKENGDDPDGEEDFDPDLSGED